MVKGTQRSFPFGPHLFAATVAAVVAAPASRAAPPVEDGAWLLAGLRRLANEGALLEASRIETMLHLTIVASAPEEGQKRSAPCADPANDRSQVVIRYAARSPWLKPTAEGVHGMVVPAFAINPRVVLRDDPAVRYAESTVQACNVRDGRLAKTRTATLEIGPLPAFACFSRDDIKRQFDAKHTLVTDGVEHVTYTAPVTGRRAASLTFTYRADAPCAISVELQQGDC